MNSVTCELSSSLSLFSPESEIRLSTAFLLQHEEEEEDEEESICASADRVSLFISSVDVDDVLFFSSSCLETQSDLHIIISVNN